MSDRTRLLALIAITSVASVACFLAGMPWASGFAAGILVSAAIALADRR